MQSNDTTADPLAHVGSTAELACVSLWSQDVFWITMPDGARVCLRKQWVPGTSTAMGSWVWSISAKSYQRHAG